MELTKERTRAAGGQHPPHDAPVLELERDALQLAKERQDKVHAALDIWIAEAIAELAAER